MIELQCEAYHCQASFQRNHRKKASIFFFNAELRVFSKEDKDHLFFLFFPPLKSLYKMDLHNSCWLPSEKQQPAAVKKDGRAATDKQPRLDLWRAAAAEQDLASGTKGMSPKKNWRVCLFVTQNTILGCFQERERKEKPSNRALAMRITILHCGGHERVGLEAVDHGEMPQLESRPATCIPRS